MNALSIALTGEAIALVAALLAAVASGHARRIMVSLGALFVSASGLWAGIVALAGKEESAVLPLGLPWLPLHLRLDALSGYFLLLIGAIGVAASLYAFGYLRHERRIVASMTFLPLFIGGMIGVLLADDAFAFMLFWEWMILSSYLLVASEHEEHHQQKAAFSYLLMAHLAGLLILAAFALLHATSGSFVFAEIRNSHLSPQAASGVLLLALIGFGAKAGLMPLHRWLPKAHPVAPSPVSALMSGVMLKVAVYGFLRIAWDLVGAQRIAWEHGAVVLELGALSCFGGVAMALQPHDLKRLLAYHSIENIGIIFLAIGLAMISAASGNETATALGLLAALAHCFNHALYKALLFMGAGAILQATGLREMERMGGLIHRMPQTAALFLLGSLAISAFPPLNGFVSEWLALQAALATPRETHTLLAAIVPFSAAVLALSGALTAACFVKVFGVVFQGQAKSRAAETAREVNGWMRGGMMLTAAGCVVIGLLAAPFLQLVDLPARLIGGASLAPQLQGVKSWLHVPIGTHQAAYSPLLVGAAVLLAAIAAYFIVWQNAGLRRAPAWNCGGGRKPHTRSGYTATGFYRPQQDVQRPSTGGFLIRTVRYHLHIDDPLASPLERKASAFNQMASERIRRIHRWGLHAWLAAMFVTLWILLMVAAR